MFRLSESAEGHGVAFVTPDKSLRRCSVRSANHRSAGARDRCLHTPLVRRCIASSPPKDCRRIRLLRISVRSAFFLTALTVTLVTQAAQGQWQSKEPARQAALKPRTAAHVSTMTVVPEVPTTRGALLDDQPDARIRQTGYAVTGDTQSVKGQHAAEKAAASQSTDKTLPPFIDLSDEPLETATAGTVEPTNTDMLIRLGTWTVIVMCLCGLTVLAIRRWQTKHGMLPVARGQSQIVETVVLGANRSVSLVELRGVQALVGCDAGGIQSIVPVPPAFPDILEGDAVGSTLSPSSEGHIESTS